MSAPAEPGAERVRIRAATPADRPAIAALLDAVMGARPRAARERLWNWRHGENPARSESIPEFLVAERGPELVGVHGLLALRVQVGEQVVPAACSCDFAVLPSGRGCGLQLKLAAMHERVAPLLLATSANGAAHKVTRAMGGHGVEAARELRFAPLRTQPFLQARLQGRVGPAWAARLAAWGGAGADLALAGRRRLRGRAQLPRGAQLLQLERIDGRADRLWETAAAAAPLQLVRDAAYLDWRYARYPFGGVRVDAIAAGDTLLGLLATQLARDPAGVLGLGVLDLIDAGQEAAVPELLLDAAFERAAREGADYLTLLPGGAPAALERALAGRGFVSRRAELSPYTYRAQRALAGRVEELARWRVALGDGDLWFHCGEPQGAPEMDRASAQAQPAAEALPGSL